MKYVCMMESRLKLSVEWSPRVCMKYIYTMEKSIFKLSVEWSLRVCMKDVYIMESRL
jgi:hypothetical protein